MKRDEILGKIVISLSNLDDHELADILESLVEIENGSVPCWEYEHEGYIYYESLDDEDDDDDY